MATHNAKPTPTSLLGDLLHTLFVHNPQIAQGIAVAGGFVASAVLLADAGLITLGMWLLFGGVFGEALVVCWRAMGAAWPDLDEQVDGDAPSATDSG